MGAAVPCHAHHLHLVGSRTWSSVPQLQGAEVKEVMQAGKTLLIATGNDVADSASQTLQCWLKLQDVLSQA